MKRKVEYEKTAFIPDIHAPYADGAALRCAYAFLRYFKPDHVFVMGDAVDFYQLSKFNKDPKRIPDLQNDIDDAVGILTQIRKASPNSKMYFLKGNHENRINTFLFSRAAELASLRALTVPALLNLKELDIKYVETGKMLFHDFLIKHGNVVRTRSGYSATGEREKAGISGASGHTHRLGQVFNSDYTGMTSWTECGCLCRIDADAFDYTEGQIPNWQQGLAYGYFEKNNHRFGIHAVPIIKGALVFDGRRISA